MYLMHWPGPGYSVMGRSKAVMEASPLGPFVYANKGHERENLKALRGKTVCSDRLQNANDLDRDLLDLVHTLIELLGIVWSSC